MIKLFELADALSDSASDEGCESDLIVVSAAPLWDLLQYVKLLKAASQTQDSSDSAVAKSICERLLDSEEHAVEAAIPEVAEDAVAVITRLSAGLAATQVALSQAMQHSEKAGRLVERIAGLSIWDYDKDDGTPYEECEEPADGYLDSHCCLMGNIEEARAVLAGNHAC